MEQNYQLIRRSKAFAECEDLLFRGINHEANEAKGLKPIQAFCLSVETEEGAIVGGVKGVIYYGCLYVDMLWIEKALRHKGWGSKLMQEAEVLGKEEGCTFATVHTMDWEALAFYQKLGYSIEFIREGYEKDSKMYLLRKALT